MELNRVFPYCVDGKTLYGDPLRLYWRFMRATGGMPDPLLEAAQQKPGTEGTEPPEDRLKRFDAEERLAAAAVEVFELTPFSPETGQGTSQSEALALLYRWLDWEFQRSQREQKKPEGMTNAGQHTP